MLARRCCLCALKQRMRRRRRRSTTSSPVEAELLNTNPDLTVLTEVRTGNPAQAIDAALRQNSASLVVMATHGRGGVLRSVTGSVAGQVLQEGRAPLMLIRPAAHTMGGVDESIAPAG